MRITHPPAAGRYKGCSESTYPRQEPRTLLVLLASPFFSFCDFQGAGSCSHHSQKDPRVSFTPREAIPLLAVIVFVNETRNTEVGVM